MEAGERELKKAFEEVTTRNVKTTIEYSKSTRAIVRELEEKVKGLEARLRVQNEVLENFRIQLAHMQTQVFSGGTN